MSVSRRDFLRGMAVAAGGGILAACAPQVVKETVEVEVEKTVEVAVEQTVVVEQTVQVEVEKEVTAVPPPEEAESLEPQTARWGCVRKDTAGRSCLGEIHWVIMPIMPARKPETVSERRPVLRGEMRLREKTISTGPARSETGWKSFRLQAAIEGKAES